MKLTPYVIASALSITVLLVACSRPSAVTPSSSTATPVNTVTSSNTATAPVPGTATMVVTAQKTATVIPELGATATQVTSSKELHSPLSNANVPLETVFGVEMSQIRSDSVLSKVKAANVRWIRRAAIPWRLIEPSEGQRNWAAISDLEREFQTASENGYKLVIVVREAPAWAQALQGISCGPIKQDKLQAFAAFMHDVVGRYSAPPYNVYYWEIWNEPDISPQLVPADSLWGCWGNESDQYYGGGAYAEMLKTVYPMVKAAQPEAQLMVGGLLLDCDPQNPPAGKDCKPARFLEGILHAGGGAYFDGVAFHAYDYYDNPIKGEYSNASWHASSATTGPVVSAKAQYVTGLLNQYGERTKFLMNTEMALICGQDGAEPRCMTQNFADTKAAYIVEAYAATFALGLRVGVWYNLSGWRGSGLLDTTGQVTLAYYAYQFAAKQFAGITSGMPIIPYPGVRGYELAKANGKLWVIWSVDGSDHTIILPNTPRSISDISGKPISNSGSITVSVMPVYLEW